MPLNKTEREFLNAYIHEATHVPFGGPATDDLRRRGIYYSDLNWLLTAYDRELVAQGTPPLGKHTPKPPPSPWTDLEHARLRNQELREECERQKAEPSGMPTAPSLPPGFMTAGKH